MDLNLTKEQQLLLLGLIASIVVGLGVTAYRYYFTASPQGIVIEEPKNQPTPAPTAMVHVCGAVRREGVYRLKLGGRLLEVLEAAGGALPSADLSALNLAEPVKDGLKVVVPVKREVVEGISGIQESRGSGTHASRVNINVADEKALDLLPGVGPSTARAIVEYRRTNGPFTRVEQIMEIPRFGKAKYERIKDRITI
jgi:competence protein ComEA